MQVSSNDSGGSESTFETEEDEKENDQELDVALVNLKQRRGTVQYIRPIPSQYCSFYPSGHAAIWRRYFFWVAVAATYVADTERSLGRPQRRPSQCFLCRGIQYDRVPVAQWLGHRTSNQRSCRLKLGRPTQVYSWWCVLGRCSCRYLRCGAASCQGRRCDPFPVLRGSRQSRRVTTRGPLAVYV